uniref:CCHC-type domain-containing protein n=1 Tax=Caenorhabditis japonica TaxID=281687 RepID=A0A8R1HHP3_CAEJA
MAHLVWRMESCLPRFSSHTDVKPVHLLELKNAAVVDLNAIAARLKEASERATAEMTALAGQANRRSASINNFEHAMDQLRQRISVLEQQQAVMESQLVSSKKGMVSPSTCLSEGGGTCASAGDAATSGGNTEKDVVNTNPTSNENNDYTDESVNQDSDQGINDVQQSADDEVRVPRVNVLGFKSTTPIGTYSGAFSESLTLFVRQFRDQMRAADAEASDAAQVNAFLTFLVGNARDRAEVFLNTNPTANVDQLVADLKAAFENELTGKLKEAQFTRCRQERGESIETYFNRVRLLAAQAFRAENREVIERRARDAFLNGLDDGIRYNVKDKDPRTCKEAFDEAIRQDILRDDRLASQQYAPTVALLDEMRSLKQEWKNSQNKSNKDRRGRFGNQDNKDKEKRRCFHCNNVGHFIRDCRKRLAGEPKAQQPNMEAVRNHHQRAPQVNAAVTEDLQAQLEVYRQQVAELQRLNGALMADSGTHG